MMVITEICLSVLRFHSQQQEQFLNHWLKWFLSIFLLITDLSYENKQLPALKFANIDWLYTMT